MRRWFIFLVLPLLVWSTYWAVGAYALKEGVAVALQGQSHGALTTRYAQAEVSGFPAGFQLNVSDLELQQAGIFSWKLPALELQAPSYQPQNIRLEIAGEQKIDTRFGELDLIAGVLEIGLFLRPALSLPLGRAQLLMEQASLTHASMASVGWSVGVERLQMDLGAFESSERGDTVVYPYQLNFEATALDLSQSGLDLPPSHQIIESLKADIMLGFSDVWDISVLDQGPPRLDMFLIRGLLLRVGSSELSMTGQLAQTATGQVFGDLLVDILQWRDLLDVLQEAGYVDPDVAALAVDFLGDQYPEDRLTLPLRIDNGQVRFGVFTLGILPALR